MDNPLREVSRSAGFAERDLMELQRIFFRLILIRFGPCEFDHLAPLLGFVGEEFAEVGRRARSSEAPSSANRACDLGSARTAFIALLTLSMISSGVFFGTPKPYQALAS